jgi:hypothetical protein
MELRKRCGQDSTGLSDPGREWSLAAVLARMDLRKR